MNDEKRLKMDRLLEATITRGASDLHINVGKVPILRLHGRLQEVGTSKIITEDDAAYLMKSITPDALQAPLNEKGSVDFSFSFRQARFRVNVSKESGHYKLTLRRLPTTLLTVDQVGLPKRAIPLVNRDNGLLLVTGPTGSGKSTTLAALADYMIKQKRGRHIITIEQPKEYVIPHGHSLVTQRQVPNDTPTFEKAVEDSLRSDPDVIIVGEARDLPTMRAAIRAAETGHLVLSTMHTRCAAHTINRVVDAFPSNEQNEVRTQLALGLLGVISQQLLPRSDGKGQIAAFEFMAVTPAISNLIRESQIHKIEDAIQTGKKQGMQLLDDHLLQLVLEEKVAASEALAKASDPERLKERIENSSK